MQMAKICGALAYHAKAKLPFISVLTNPTTGGVTASHASVGDLIIAEPHAMICFAGPRVIKDTTQAELPPGFQTAEFLLEHGLIDAIVPRKEMKKQFVDYLDFVTTGLKRNAAPA
jgi:acetyl-CoA carboxylase carboxyl transferase subunit beta